LLRQPTTVTLWASEKAALSKGGRPLIIERRPARLIVPHTEAPARAGRRSTTIEETLHGEEVNDFESTNKQQEGVGIETSIH